MSRYLGLPAHLDREWVGKNAMQLVKDVEPSLLKAMQIPNSGSGSKMFANNKQLRLTEEGHKAR